MMKRYIPLFAAVLFPSAVTAATSDTTKVSLVIPVSCAVEVVGESVSDNRLTLTLHRRCNTWHTLKVDGLATPGEAVTMRFNHASVSFAGGSATLPQDQRFFDGFDTLVVEMAAPAADIAQYANSLRVTIEA